MDKKVPFAFLLYELLGFLVIVLVACLFSIEKSSKISSSIKSCKSLKKYILSYGNFLLHFYSSSSRTRGDLRLSACKLFAGEFANYCVHAACIMVGLRLIQNLKSYMSLQGYFSKVTIRILAFLFCDILRILNCDNQTHVENQSSGGGK